MPVATVDVRVRSPRQAESQMCDSGALDDTDRLQFDSSITEVFEEAGSAAEERGHEMDLDLVEEPGTKALLGDARAEQAHVLVACGCLSLFDGALDHVGHQRSRGLAVWRGV